MGALARADRAPPPRLRSGLSKRRPGEAKPDIGVTAPWAMIVAMAYDEDLANRIRELIASEDDYGSRQARCATV